MGRSMRSDLDAGCTHQTYLGSGPTLSVKCLYPAWGQLTSLGPFSSQICMLLKSYNNKTCPTPTLALYLYPRHFSPLSLNTVPLHHHMPQGYSDLLPHPPLG